MRIKEITKQARVYGIVQGVGFRPTVSRHASKHGIVGSVCNKGPFVEIFAQGAEDNVDAFLQAVCHQAPERSVILKMDVEVLAEEECRNFDHFQIIESEKIKGDIFVSPDIATCPKCQKEMYDPKDRRYLHPFINCTSCGPRLTILDSMPYDRVRTSMASFPMCKKCEEEYYGPESRRYDAQPVCCNDCGPEVYLLDEEARREQAIRAIRLAICQGEIVAIKGIGGFHLCCDATNEAAVRLLRERKKRPAKPFAVMMKNIDTVRRECQVTASQESILTGHQKPIILLKRKEGPSKVSLPVAPDNPKLGVMLPYAPIHFLLFDYPDEVIMPDCLVMTSANTSGAPICRDDEDARRELGHLCDHILSHNRLIRLRADDTVMDYHEDQPYMIRRSRGYAPLPFSVHLPWKGEVLAVGGELKNTFCIVKNQLFYPSPYVGDMGDLRTVKALDESVRRMEDLLEARPTLLACDMHPRYNTSSFAQDYGKEKDMEIFPVQHHYAHILSCMVENDVNEKVIGVSYDGTGYGLDGSVWGGEILLCDYSGFERKASITPFDQVGGDLSSKEGWRIAVSLLKDLYGLEQGAALAEELGLCKKTMALLSGKMAQNGVNTVKSTSAGRIFDAVSAILGIRLASSFEGEASCQLQFAAERAMADFAEKKELYQAMEDELLAMKMTGEDRILLATNALVGMITQQFLQGCQVEFLALCFHKLLARMTVKACWQIAQETGVYAVALSGGVYQNTLLLKETISGLQEQGFRVFRHRLLPPNDGGICVGQAAAALYYCNHMESNDSKAQ